MKNARQPFVVRVVRKVILACMALMAIIAATKIMRQNDQIAAFEAERVQWQTATKRAVDARDWVGFDQNQLTPNHLVYALNPCQTPTGKWCDSDAECQEAEYRRDFPNRLPIKIELATR